MNEMLVRATRNVFAYTTIPHDRRHGPRGYADYRAYKPWLRDEFTFRCVYCLTRERWYPSGQEEFSVEHLRPQASAPEARVEYDNLLYACSSCNRNRQSLPLPFNPAEQPLGQHVRVIADGTVEALTSEGRALIRACHLNRPLLLRHRRQLLALLKSLKVRQADEMILRDILGFPDDLPDLAARHPPGGNSRPAGIRQSCFEQRRRRELPGAY